MSSILSGPPTSGRTLAAALHLANAENSTSLIVTDVHHRQSLFVDILDGITYGQNCALENSLIKSRQTKDKLICITSWQKFKGLRRLRNVENLNVVLDFHNRPQLKEALSIIRDVNTDKIIIIDNLAGKDPLAYLQVNIAVQLQKQYARSQIYNFVKNNQKRAKLVVVDLPFNLENDIDGTVACYNFLQKTKNCEKDIVICSHRFQNYNMILQNATINEHQAHLGIGYLYENQDAVFHPSITAFLNYPRYTLSASLSNVTNTVYLGRLKDCPHDARKLVQLLSEYELEIDQVLDFSSEHKSDIDFNIF